MPGSEARRRRLARGGRVPLGYYKDPEKTAERFIEVKGRRVSADDVEVTRNEVLTALNAPEQFILALVEVEGDEGMQLIWSRPNTNRD